MQVVPGQRGIGAQKRSSAPSSTALHSKSSQHGSSNGSAFLAAKNAPSSNSSASPVLAVGHSGPKLRGGMHRSVLPSGSSPRHGANKHRRSKDPSNRRGSAPEQPMHRGSSFPVKGDFGSNSSTSSQQQELPKWKVLLGASAEHSAADSENFEQQLYRRNVYSYARSNCKKAEQKQVRMDISQQPTEEVLAEEPPSPSASEKGAQAKHRKSISFREAAEAVSGGVRQTLLAKRTAEAFWLSVAERRIREKLSLRTRAVLKAHDWEQFHDDLLEYAKEVETLREPCPMDSRLIALSADLQRTQELVIMQKVAHDKCAKHYKSLSSRKAVLNPEVRWKKLLKALEFIDKIDNSADELQAMIAALACGERNPKEERRASDEFAGMDKSEQDKLLSCLPPELTRQMEEALAADSSDPILLEACKEELRKYGVSEHDVPKTIQALLSHKWQQLARDCMLQVKQSYQEDVKKLVVFTEELKSTTKAPSDSPAEDSARSSLSSRSSSSSSSSSESSVNPDQNLERRNSAACTSASPAPTARNPASPAPTGKQESPGKQGSLGQATGGRRPSVTEILAQSQEAYEHIPAHATLRRQTLANLTRPISLVSKHDPKDEHPTDWMTHNSQLDNESAGLAHLKPTAEPPAQKPLAPDGTQPSQRSRRMSLDMNSTEMSGRSLTIRRGRRQTTLMKKVSVGIQEAGDPGDQPVDAAQQRCTVGPMVIPRLPTSEDLFSYEPMAISRPPPDPLPGPLGGALAELQQCVTERWGGITAAMRSLASSEASKQHDTEERIPLRKLHESLQACNYHRSLSEVCVLFHALHVRCKEESAITASDFLRLQNLSEWYREKGRICQRADVMLRTLEMNRCIMQSMSISELPLAELFIAKTLHVAQDEDFGKIGPQLEDVLEGIHGALRSPLGASDLAAACMSRMGLHILVDIITTPEMPSNLQILVIAIMSRALSQHGGNPFAARPTAPSPTDTHGPPGKKFVRNTLVNMRRGAFGSKMLRIPTPPDFHVDSGPSELETLLAAELWRPIFALLDPAGHYAAEHIAQQETRASKRYSQRSQTVPFSSKPLDKCLLIPLLALLRQAHVPTTVVSVHAVAMVPHVLAALRKLHTAGTQADNSPSSTAESATEESPEVAALMALTDLEALAGSLETQASPAQDKDIYAIAALFGGCRILSDCLEAITPPLLTDEGLCSSPEAYEFMKYATGRLALWERERSRLLARWPAPRRSPLELAKMEAVTRAIVDLTKSGASMRWQPQKLVPLTFRAPPAPHSPPWTSMLRATRLSPAQPGGDDSLEHRLISWAAQHTYHVPHLRRRPRAVGETRPERSIAEHLLAE